MKTFLPKPTEIERKWYVIDVTDQTLGSLATTAAKLLRGKSKPIFTPHMDTGDGVVIINAEKIRLTGNKWSQKTYYSHSGYSGGLKEITAEKLMEKKPTEMVTKAISGMIPKNRLKKEILKRLRVFAGPEHTLQAQKPELLSLS